MFEDSPIVTLETLNIIHNNIIEFGLSDGVRALLKQEQALAERVNLDGTDEEILVDMEGLVAFVKEKLEQYKAWREKKRMEVIQREDLRRMYHKEPEKFYWTMFFVYGKLEERIKSGELKKFANEKVTVFTHETIKAWTTEVKKYMEFLRTITRADQLRELNENEFKIWLEKQVNAQKFKFFGNFKSLEPSCGIG
ncbi:MAG: hypothetical protein ACTSWQ_09390, partial [Candidatus Thorarchaeota archaeon]